MIMFDEKLNLIEKGEEKEVKLLCTVTKRKGDEKKLAVSPFVSPVHFSFFSRTKKKEERKRAREKVMFYFALFDSTNATSTSDKKGARARTGDKIWYFTAARRWPD